MQAKRSELPLIIALGFVLAIAATAMAAPMQRPYYRSANGHGYVLCKAPTANSSAMAAEADAVAAGGHLVAVNDAAEDAFIRTTFDGTVNPGVASDATGPVAGYWMGLTDDAAFGRTEGNFGWMNGEAVAYTNWASPNPDNFGGVENFVGKGANAVANGGQWIDVPETFAGSVAGVAELSTPRAVADTFDGATGTAFAGTVTPVGGRTWAATSNLIFSTAGAPDTGKVTSSSATGFTKSKADTPLDLAANVALISVQADVRDNQAANGANMWSLIGLLETSMDGMRPGSGGLDDSVSIAVEANGTMHLFAVNDGVGVLDQNLGTLAQWRGPGGNVKGEYFNLQLVYDPSDASVDVYVNNILKGSDILLGFTPQLGYAGFQTEKDTGNIGANSVWFDNFASMVVTPEPASLALLAMGLSLLVRRNRK